MLAAAARVAVRSSFTIALALLILAVAVLHAATQMRCQALQEALGGSAAPPDYGAAQALAAMGEPGRACLLRALEFGDPSEKAAAAFGLSQYPTRDEEIVSALAAAMDSPFAGVRLEAVCALEVMGPDAATAVPDLVKAGGSADRCVRCAAAQALAQVGPMALPDLGLALSSDDARERESAVLAIHMMGPEAWAGMTDRLEACMADASPSVRVRAARAWLAIPGAPADRAVSALQSVLRSGDVEATLGAVQTVLCLRLGTPRVLRALEWLMGQGDPKVRGAAECALELLAAWDVAPSGAGGAWAG
jgi:hypothetical protein